MKLMQYGEYSENVNNLFNLLAKYSNGDNVSYKNFICDIGKYVI